MANEMAHYAADCWDAELLTSYGWIECVGCADRSAFDLSVHSKKTGAPLCVRETRSEPLKIEEWQIELDRKKLGPLFKKDGKTVEAALEASSQDLREELSMQLRDQGKVEIEVAGVGDGKVEIGSDLIKIEKRTRVEHVREYIPNVIEPAFGIGRILYSLFEHVYWSREGDEARGVSLSCLSSSQSQRLNIHRFSPSFQPSHLQRFYWFLYQPTPTSNPWSIA